MSDQTPVRTCKSHPGISLPPSRMATGCRECKRESRSRSRNGKQTILTIEDGIRKLEAAMAHLELRYRRPVPARHPVSGTMHNIVVWTDMATYAARRLLQRKLTFLRRTLWESKRKANRRTLA